MTSRTAPRRLLGGALILLALQIVGALQPRRAPAQTAQDSLWEAAKSGDVQVVARALEAGAVIDSLDTRTNPNGRRALNWAAWYDQVEVISYLLDRGAPIDLVNNTGFSALHHAAEAGSLGAAGALIAAGADVNLPNRAGATPLDTAIERENFEVAELLMEHGAMGSDELR